MKVDNNKLSKLLQGSDEDIDIALIIIQKHCKEENLNWVTYYKSLLPPRGEILGVGVSPHHTDAYAKVFRRAFKHIKL